MIIKKFTAVLLLVLLTMFSSIALGESPEQAPSFDYEGTWKTVMDYGFQLYLPNEWVIYTEEKLFTAGTDNGSQYLWVESFESAGYSLDDVFLEFSQVYEDAKMLQLGDAKSVTFKVPKSDIYCGVLLSKDEATLYFVRFMPLKDEATIDIADKILTSFSPIPM